MLKPVRKLINPPYSVRDIFIIFGVLIILLAIPLATIATQTSRGLSPEAARGGKGERPETPPPMTVVKESFHDAWQSGEGCVTEDDTFTWRVEGSLGPGETYRYTPNTPNCDHNSRVVYSGLSWDRRKPLTSDLEFRVVSYNSNYPEKIDILAKKGDYTSASICLFPFSGIGPVYYFEVKNVGDQRAYNISVWGKNENQWLIHYWPHCTSSDADWDGWSDSIELAMRDLGTGQFHSSGYLKCCGTATPNDEPDFWPPDLNDDGVVTQADVDIILNYVGQGNGVSPGSGIQPNKEQYQRFEWRRFDLNADGYVTTTDVDLVKNSLGAKCQGREALFPK